MKITKVHFFLLIIFVSYPFAALPIIFIEIYNRKYYALKYLTFFMGLLAYLWLPSGDLYRYQLDYEFFKTLNFREFSNLPKLDLVLPWLLFLFGKAGFYFEYVRLVLCIISYLLYFSIYIDIIHRNDNLIESRRVSFFSFLMFFFFIGFAGFLTGVRYSFAMSLCFYSVYQIIYKNKNSGWFILVLSVITHYSMSLILIIVIVSKLFKPKITRLYFIISLFVGFIISSVLLNYIIDILPLNEILKTRLLDYTKEDAIVNLSEHTIGYRLSFLFTYFSIYPALILLLYKCKDYSSFLVFVFICIALSLMTEIFTSYSRYAALGVVFFIFPFLLQYKTLFTKLQLYFFVILSFFVYSTSIYTFRKELSYGKEYKILYFPLPAILMTTYDIKWLNDNITSNGDLRYSTK